MQDENRTPSTETPNSPTPQTEKTPTNDAPKPGADGEEDAPEPGGQGDEADDSDVSLIGGAGAKAGTGNDDSGDEAEGGDSDDSEGEGGKPPEAYELSVTVKGEDGKDVPVEIDQELLTAATPVFREAGLTNEQANKLAPLAMEVERRVVARQSVEFAAIKKDWADQVMKDPEIGGKNWPKTEGAIARALDHFGAPSKLDEEGRETNEFRVLLNDTGLTNHPVFVKMFAAIGAAVREDPGLVDADANPPAKRDRLETLYPDDVPNKKQGAK